MKNDLIQWCQHILPIVSDTGQGLCIETWELDSVFFLMTSCTEHERCCDMELEFRCHMMGERMAYGGLPLPVMCCHVPDVGKYHSVWNNVYGILFLHSSTSMGHLCPWTLFLNNWLVVLPWTSLTLCLHTKLMIIGSGVSGLATVYPCGIWCREWKFGLMDGNVYWFLVLVYVCIYWQVFPFV